MNDEQLRLGLLRGTNFLLAFAVAQETIAPAAKEAFASLTVFAIELDEALTFDSIGGSAGLRESANQPVVFGFDAPQEVYCQLAVVRYVLPSQPSVTEWSCYIDEQRVRRHCSE